MFDVYQIQELILLAALIVLGALFSVPVMNLLSGISRKISDFRDGRPTFRPGAMFVKCITPNGTTYPDIFVVKAGLFGVTFGLTDSVPIDTALGSYHVGYSGPIVWVENAELKDWVFAMSYDPRKPTE